MKKLFAILLAVLMLVSAAACGNADKPAEAPAVDPIELPESAAALLDAV